MKIFQKLKKFYSFVLFSWIFTLHWQPILTFPSSVSHLFPSPSTQYSLKLSPSKWPTSHLSIRLWHICASPRCLSPSSSRPKEFSSSQRLFNPQHALLITPRQTTDVFCTSLRFSNLKGSNFWTRVAANTRCFGEQISQEWRFLRDRKQNALR